MTDGLWIHCDHGGKPAGCCDQCHALGFVPAGVTMSEVDQMRRSLESCRLLAAREAHRHHRGHNPPRGEMWDHVLRFCTEAGVKGSILRTGEPDPGAT